MSAIPGPPLSDHLALQLLAERTIIEKRTVQGSTVRVATETALREEHIAEPVHHEVVDIERVAINRVVDIAPAIRQEGDVTILPVVEEVLVLERRLVLKEEIRVRRHRVTQMHRQTVSLREQSAIVRWISPEPEAASSSQLSLEQHPSIEMKESFVMSEQTIVAVYDTPAHAELAVQDLRAANIPAAAIDRHAQEGSYIGASSAAAARPEKEGFWSRLFGGEPDHDTAVYDRSLASGGTAVTVRVPEDQANAVVDILERHGPVDLDDRASGYGLARTTTTEPLNTGSTYAAGTAGALEGGTIQLSEERLAVGKRVVNRGGTRIRRFVVETPVEEQVTLHDEKVTLDRRAVTDGRPVTNADFSDKTIEMTEMAEEAVVAKQAYVTEEISLRKESRDRVETIRDTVRREDVEIERIPGDAAISTKPGQPGYRKD